MKNNKKGFHRYPAGQKKKEKKVAVG